MIWLATVYWTYFIKWPIAPWILPFWIGQVVVGSRSSTASIAERQRASEVPDASPVAANPPAVLSQAERELCCCRAGSAPGIDVPLVSLIFLKRSLVFPIQLFSSISLHWSLRKAFLSLLAILWNSAFKWVYLSFSPVFFTSLLFTAIYKASSDSHFAFVHFFFLGMVLLPVSCTMSWTSVHGSSAFCLSELVP